jgi:hypothetical protein
MAAVEPLDEIVLTNPKILKYFNSHPDINPEVIFLFFIEILEKFGDNLQENINASMRSQILQTLNENTSILAELNYNLTSKNTDLINALQLKMHEVRKEYVSDMKSIIASNTAENMANILEKNNSHLIDKTTILLNDTIPKTNQVLYMQVYDKIRTFQQENEKLIRAIDTKTDTAAIVKYINDFETKFPQILSGIQEPQEKIMENLTEFLNKFRNSTSKGQMGEKKLNMVLNGLYPSAEIVDTRGQTACGDFLMRRDDAPTIMFETKDYTDNVFVAEIRKFIRDVENINTHSIFLSQHSGIATKSNYQIEFHNGNILVYVHNVEYSPEKIKIAVDIIDSLYEKLDNIYTEDMGDSISKETLDEINREYQAFAQHKEALISNLRETMKRNVALVEELKFPSLENYLSLKFASTANDTRYKGNFTCELCKARTFASYKSLSAHLRGCKKKHEAAAAAAAPGGAK